MQSVWRSDENFHPYKVGTLDPTPSTGSKLDLREPLGAVSEGGADDGGTAHIKHHQIDKDQDVLKFLRDHFSRQACSVLNMQSAGLPVLIWRSQIYRTR